MFSRAIGFWGRLGVCVACFAFILINLNCQNANASSRISDLPTTFAPLTAATVQGTRWVTVESKLDVPINLEEHLLTHYIEMWGEEGGPESYEKLKSSFDAILPEKKGYPLVNPNGDINTVAAMYWIGRHMQLNLPVAENRNLSRNEKSISIDIDQNKTSIDEAKQLLHLVYRVRFEVPPNRSDAELTTSLPLSLHDSYMTALGGSTLRSSAIDYLKKKELPRPRLEWRRLMSDVKNTCLGAGVVEGILTMSEFLDKFQPGQNKCYLSPEQMSKTLIAKSEAPPKDVKVYPEYHELFKDNNLSVLFAVQECNDTAYSCGANDFGQRTKVEQLLSDLKDFGYSLVEKKPNLLKFRRQVGELNISLSVFYQKRPVHYENTFWQLYKDAEVVVTNRLPLLSEQFNRVQTAHYQIVLSSSASELAWGKILPQLDYSLESFDGVETNLDQLPRGQVLRFIENVAQTSKVYRQRLDAWKTDTDWQYLLTQLEKVPAGEEKGSAVAHFVRGNVFKPGVQASAIDFNKAPALDQYIELLNANGGEEISRTINYRLAYLYLTLHYGDKANSFEDLQSELKNLCETRISNAKVKSWYFFRRGCAPKSLLTSERTKILGVNFARGSFLELYAGAAGIPKYAYLADTTQIGNFKFKAYFDDTAGAVEFYRTSGKVMQGHLATHMNYQGLPLHGGMGTSMVRFYEDGTLKTALLRENAEFTYGNNKMTFHGTTRGPQQVSFHPNGKLECAYLATSQAVDSYELAGVNAPLEGVEGSKEDRKVCFHANGKLRSGMLAKESMITNVPYPVGSKLSFSSEGKLLGPIYQVMGEGESYWGTAFPKGSLYVVDAETSNPKWVRLNGPMNLKNNTFPKGTEISFNERGYFNSVKAPADGEPRIALRDFAISVPKGAQLIFSDSTPSELIFSGSVKIGDVTYVPGELKEGSRQMIRFHENGRVASGILASDTVVADPHYGQIPLRGGSEIEFTEEGRLSAGTLAGDYVFTYTILDESEMPKKGMLGKQLTPVRLPAGTRVSLSDQAKLEEATLTSVWREGDLRVEAGGDLNFNEAHQIERITFAKTGGQVGAFDVAEGNVKLYPSGFPMSIELAKGALINGMSIPAGASVQFFASKLIKAISSPENKDLTVEIDGRKFTREIAFYESGKVKNGYLAEDITYGGVQIASLTRCQQLRFSKVNESRGDSCAVAMYEDGKSLVSGVAAENISVSNGRNILAGQPVEFDEDGKLYLK